MDVTRVKGGETRLRKRGKGKERREGEGEGSKEGLGTGREKEEGENRGALISNREKGEERHWETEREKAGEVQCKG